MSKLMPTESERDDAAAVAAVRSGDLERYSELVDRHERRIFAIAWSRLGDASLAEEVTQEAFIRGYQRLNLLGNESRFASWIGAIARNLAINIGLRQRRELNRRERWALESETAPADRDEEAPSAETLRQALERLPAVHRECLVLYYIERKSGAEAAAALGIGESAFRVRLHRARAALREQLEESLAESLGKLGPSRSLVPAVMTALAAASTAKAASVGTGTTLVAGAAKFIPLGWLVPYISWFGLLPVPVVAWFYARAEARNFREPKGFRARLLQEGVKRRLLWLFPLMLALLWLTPSLHQFIGQRFLFLVLGVACGLFTLPMIRALAINRTRYLKVAVAHSIFLTTGCLALGLGAIPGSAFLVVLAPSILMTAWTFGERPVRMDYSLFLRARERLLPAVESPAEATGAHPREMLAFARFLGNRWLVTHYRWTSEGLALALTGLKGLRWGLFEHVRASSRRSVIVLKTDGTAPARLGSGDRKELENSLPTADADDMEQQVGGAVTEAWQAFRSGDLARTDAALGERSEEELFRVAPGKTGLTRWHRRFATVWAVLALSAGWLTWFKQPWMEGLKPVSVSKAEVRAALAGMGQRNGTNWLIKGLPGILSFGLAFPPGDWFTPDARAALHEEIFKLSGFRADAEVPARCATVMQAWLLSRAIDATWITLEDLGISEAAITQYLREPKPYTWKFYLARHQFRGDDGAEFTVEGIDARALGQLRFLSELGCLDVVDRDAIVEQAAALQVRSGEASGGRPALRNWKDLRGLWVAGRPLLQDTYHHVAALELLGGLDRIDREACIRAILKLHRGGGFFVEPDTHEKWRYRVRDGARDTYSAFRTLQILGALDRVPDLPEWEWRITRRESKSEDVVTWAEIEAWVMKEEFARAISRK